LPPLPRVDADDWLHDLDLAEQALADAEVRAPWDAAKGQLDALRAEEAVPDALHQLPTTLLHGDVHGGNMITSCVDGRTYLVDWGSARLGPVGLDLANCIGTVESAAWREYWSQAQLFGYRATPAEQARNFYVGKVYISVHYLPYAIAHCEPGHAARMLREALEAARALRQTAADG
jgi:aminoglycoside phosphotransferase (APT) family kinase protein